MKPKELVLATALIVLLGILLGGCQVVEPTSKKEVGQTVIEQFMARAVAAKKEVGLKLTAEKVGKTVKVKIALENPNVKPITSVQSWLSYDPSLLKGVSVSAEGSAFSLQAPFDNTFDGTKGILAIGRSSPKAVESKSVLVAEATFEVVGEGVVMVDAYDYQDDLSGHTSVNTLVRGKPFNILRRPESPLLVIE